MGGGGGSCSSSGEEDGDAAWRDAINSITSPQVAISASNRATRSNPDSVVVDSTQIDDDSNPYKKKGANPGFKLYQLKAQKILDDFVGKNLELVRTSIPDPCTDPPQDEGGIRLFRRAPRGIVLNPIDSYSLPLKRPRIVPGEEIDEKSKEFRHQLRSVAINGVDVISSARDACQKSLARYEARGAATTAKAKREEERIAELKKIRGERWLPSVAREMQKGT